MADQTALVVEDTAANRDFFERLIAMAGFKVLSAENGKQALEAAAGCESLTLAIVDMQIPDMSGLQVTAQLRKLRPDACIVIATMHDEHSLMVSAFARGCDVFMVKPYGFMDLYKRLTTNGVTGMRSEGPLIIDQFGPRPAPPAVPASS